MATNVACGAMNTVVEKPDLIAMWDDLCNDPSLSNAAYKFEITPEGKIIMAPTSSAHAYWQFDLGFMLKQHGGSGNVAVELPVRTQGGLFEVDVTWASPGVAAVHRAQKVATVAPEICIEIASPSNPDVEYQRKRNSLFSAGAKEFWVLSTGGFLTFHMKENPDVAVTGSNLMPGFPSKIEKS